MTTAGQEQPRRVFPMELPARGRGKAVISKTLLVVFVNLFIVSCVFDPADLLFKLKVPLFCACWLLFGLFCLYNPGRYKAPIGLVAYVVAMIVIPAWSIGYYFATNGSQPFEGFALFKAYILISFALLLYLNKLDALKVICVTLTALALAIITASALLKSDSALAEPIQLLGERYGILNINTRDYGSDLSMELVFFVVSPMLVLPIAYYTHLTLTTSGLSRLRNGSIALLNIVAMFVAGTRTNLLTAILLPVALLIMHGRKRILVSFCAGVAVIVGAAHYWDQIMILLSAEETSNHIKLGLLQDYWTLFSDPKILLFGQGLGAYHYWTPRGFEFYITELTFLDTIRFFGVFMGAIILGLLLYPIFYAFVINPRFKQKHIIIAYGFYLAACIGQPLFFSSMGMLILSIVLANIFMDAEQRRGTVSAHGSALKPGRM